MKDKIGIICNKGDGNQIGGQITKSNEICRYFEGKSNNIYEINVFRKNIITLFIEIYQTMCNSSDVIIILSSYGFLRVLPLLVFLKKIYHCKIHEIVIGGVRQDFLIKRKIKLRLERDVDYIYVESKSMVEKYNEIGFNNVLYLPNFKSFDDIEQCKYKKDESRIRLCTFSRIDKYKGIDSAVEIVRLLNSRANGKKEYILDIYGPIDENYKEEFQELVLAMNSKTVCYKGIKKTEDAQSVLKKYDVMLFPTHWKAEGFPGTFIDALSAGLPIVASKRNSFEDVIIDGKNGFLVDEYNAMGFCKRIKEITDDSSILYEYKQRALETAKSYKTENVLSKIKILSL